MPRRPSIVAIRPPRMSSMPTLRGGGDGIVARINDAGGAVLVELQARGAPLRIDVQRDGAPVACADAVPREMTAAHVDVALVERARAGRAQLAAPRVRAVRPCDAVVLAHDGAGLE